MKLETLVQRVSSFIATHPNERDCWQKAPALSGLLAWDMPEFRSVAKKWIDRAVATQKSDGNLSYGDWHTSSGGHIRSFTPLASETAAVGAPMLEWHERHPEARYLESARRQYVSLCNAPRTAEGGIWSRGEGPELWIDFTYLMCPFMARYGKLAADPAAIDEAFRQFAVHVRRLLDAETRLARHAWCEKPNHFPQSTFWARGNGWMAVGMPEMLRMLPKSSKYDVYRDRILAEYKKMMATLSAYQYDSGLWGQLIHPNQGDMWEETSGSAMFTYAMILGVKNGWLDKKIYGTAARKAWLGIQNYLNTNFEIRNVCCGTGAGTSYAYYRDRDKYTGDLHGQAAVMWCAYALTELANEQKQ